MTQAEPGVGDLVVVPYPAARERIGCGTEVGLVLEDRRHVVKVFFPAMARMFWLERAQLERVAPGRLPADPLVEKLHRTAGMASSDLIEFYDGDDREGGVVHVFSRGLTADELDGVRALWAGDLVALRLVPANMRHMRLELVLRDPVR